MKLPGQIDVKNLVTTLIATAIIGAGGFVWKKLDAAGDQFAAIDKRLTRIEDALDRALPASKRKP